MSDDDKKKESSGGKHLAEKSTGIGPLFKPQKKPRIKKNYQGFDSGKRIKSQNIDTLDSSLDEDFPMAAEGNSMNQRKHSEKTSASQSNTKKQDSLLNRTWFKVLVAVVTVVAVFGICILISNILSANENNAELPLETETPAPSLAPAPESDSGPLIISQAPSPTPTEEPTPSPVPSEEPSSTPTSADSSALVTDTLATPAILPETEDCGQLLLLDSTGSTGSLMYYEKDSDGWHLLMTSGATLGKNGVSNNKKEGDNTTPSGEYPLLFVYGETQPITQMPFQKLTADSVWVDDSRSKYYNTLQSTGNPDRDWSSCESVYERYFKGGTHKACIYVGYNGDGLTPETATPGKGSMITICGKTDSLTPTAGCIDIFNTDMTKLLQYLDPTRNPVIIID